MDKHIIKKSIPIMAPPQRVFEMLVNHQYISKWANEFSPGTSVEANWQQGGTVAWKDKDGQVGARGIVTLYEPNRQLTVAYYDDTEPVPGEQPGEYKENFLLQSAGGGTQLQIEAGPLAAEHFDKHSPLWDSALQVMKQLAENK